MTGPARHFRIDLAYDGTEFAGWQAQAYDIQLKPAWDAFGEAQEMFEETGQFVPWAENQLGLARVALRQGDLEHSLTLCRRVQAFARREGLNRIEAAAWLVLSEIQVCRTELRTLCPHSTRASSCSNNLVWLVRHFIPVS